MNSTKWHKHKEGIWHKVNKRPDEVEHFPAEEFYSEVGIPANYIELKTE